MSSSFEKSVKGATKIKAAPPKTKYIEHILVATHAGEAGVGEVFRALQFRLRDSTWTVVFKSLITVHLMIREGSPDVTLAFLARHPNTLAISNFTDAQTQGRNIRHYANYLSARAKAFRETKCDWVRTKESRLEKLTVEKGLLRETEILQTQITALLKCDVLEGDVENEITVTVFRLLVLDLLALFQALNQGMINILGNFFEMSKVDAERAMSIYRNFTKQTDFVVQYLSIARQFEHQTRVEVPKLKHAPVNLGRQLEEYLHDPDFEVNRRQYIAEQQAKKNGGTVSKSSASAFDSKPAPAANNPFPSTNEPFPSANGLSQSKPETAKGPAPDLIDFFESIEQNQTTMAPNQQQHQQQQQMPMQTGFASNSPFQPQPTGFQQNGFAAQQNGFAAQPTGFGTNPYQPQSTNPFGQVQQQPQQQQPAAQPLQPNFTGAGFGGFTPQPQQGFQPGALGSIPQDSVASFQTGQQTGMLSPQAGQQITNPFRASMLMAQQTGMTTNSAFPTPDRPQTQGGLQRQSTNPFARSSPQAQQPFSPAPSNSPFQSQPTGQAPAAAPLQPMMTGTNPFAKSFTGSQLQQQRPATSSGALLPQPTGTTNPFRQGAFVNHQTGMGWQHNQQAIGGGLDNLETVPVFPRPIQQTPWQT